MQDKISKSLVSLVFGANHLGDQLPAAMAPLEDYLKTVRRRCAVIICFCPCSFFLSSVCFIFSIAREPIDATPEDHFEDQVSAAMALLEDFLSVQSVREKGGGTTRGLPQHGGPPSSVRFSFFSCSFFSGSFFHLLFLRTRFWGFL